MLSKIFSLFFLITVSLSATASAPDIALQLQKADSLFNERKFTEAFEVYNSILEKEKKFSPQMLLKMAFIKEALGDYTYALYYLNLLYNHEPDKDLLKKMEELGSKHHLSGYNYTDLQYFLSLYKEYYYYIIFFFLFAGVSFYIYVLIRKIHRRRLGARPLLFIIILAIVYYISNYNISPPQGIIMRPQVMIMKSPSAGAPVMAVAGRGNRVSLIDKTDIWYKIRWNDDEGYIRENNLLLIDAERTF